MLSTKKSGHGCVIPRRTREERCYTGASQHPHHLNWEARARKGAIRKCSLVLVYSLPINKFEICVLFRCE